MFQVPVHGTEVLLKGLGVNIGFADVQLNPGIVVNEVDTHFIHEAIASLMPKCNGQKKAQII